MRSNRPSTSANQPPWWNVQRSEDAVAPGILTRDSERFGRNICHRGLGLWPLGEQRHTDDRRSRMPRSMMRQRTVGRA